MKKFLAIVPCALASVTAFAQEAQTPTVETALTDLSGKFTGLLNSAIPTVLTLIGTAIVITAIFFGIRLFRRALKTGSAA